ncbi:MAG: GNAT family N-acetyltransferase [Pseudomonadota bacterium]
MIRAARTEEAAELSALARAAFAPYAPAIGRMPAPALQDFPAAIAGGNVWVAGRPPRGYVVAFAKAGAWFLENVAVAPVAQGQGMGQTLIAFAEEEGRRRGFDRITLYTNAKMAAPLALYTALGYTETGRRREDGFDRVYFERRL